MAERQIEVRRSKVPYTNIQNALIWDEALQPKTRWLLIAMLSLPDDWDYSVRGLAVKTGMSKDTIAKMMGELERAGYLCRKQTHEEAGRFGQIRYILSDVRGEFGAPEDAPEPCPKNADAVGENAPCPNLPCPVQPDPVNSPQQNNIITNTPYSPPRGDGGEGGQKCASMHSLELFEQFWAAYPRKKNKDRARRTWKKLKPDLETCRAMAAALERDKVSRQWTKDNGEYIPHPSTWLNNRPWEDGDCELPPATPARDEPLRGEGVKYL